MNMFAFYVTELNEEKETNSSSKYTPLKIYVTVIQENLSD
jgi:hypothetical protein